MTSAVTGQFVKLHELETPPNLQFAYLTSKLYATVFDKIDVKNPKTHQKFTDCHMNKNEIWSLVSSLQKKGSNVTIYIYIYPVHNVLKNVVYGRKVRDLAHFRQLIIEAVELITLHMLINTWQELEYRLDICRATTGAHIEVYGRA